jgi:DivIVA domain-containing protein
MTDDTFTLTPHDIRSQEFPRAFRGLDPVHVEAFKQRISEEFERVLRTPARGAPPQFPGTAPGFRDRERAMNERCSPPSSSRRCEAQARKESEAILRERELTPPAAQ